MSMFAPPSGSDPVLAARLAALEEKVEAAKNKIDLNKDDADGQIAALTDARAQGDQAAQDGIDAAISGSVERTDDVASQLGGEIQNRVADIARLESLIGDGSDAVKSFFIPKTRNILALDEVGARTWYNDNAQYILEWIEALQNYGAEGLITNPNDDGSPAVYMTTPAVSDLNRSLRIVGRGNPIIKGVEDSAADYRAVLRFNGDALVRPELKLVDFEIDNSRRFFAEAQPSGTCLTVHNVGRLILENMRGYAGDDYQTAQDEKKGDSFLSTVDCDTVIALKCRIQGQPDKVWYISRATNLLLWANEYINCNTVAALTRINSRSLAVSGEIVRGCGLGYEVLFTDGTFDEDQPIAGHIMANNIVFIKCGGRLFYCRGNGSIDARQIHVRDWGWFGREAKNGIWLPTSSRAVARLDGTSGSYLDIDMAMQDWPDSDQHRGFDLRNYNAGGGIVYACSGNRLNGRISNLPQGQGIVETGATRGTISDIIYDNVSTARNSGYGESPVPSSQLTGSVHRMRDNANNLVIQKNGIPYSSLFTLTPIALGGGAVFGPAATNECHYSRVPDTNQITPRVKLFAPFTLVTAASGSVTISGNVMTVISGGPFAVGQVIFDTGQPYAPKILSVNGDGTYGLDMSMEVSPHMVRGVVDGEIRLQQQLFQVAAGNGSIVPDLASLPFSRGILSVSGAGWEKGLEVGSPTDGVVLDGTKIIDDLGYNATLGLHQYRVSRSQTVAFGPLTGNSVSKRFATGEINGYTMILSSGSFAAGQGVEGNGVLRGTVVLSVDGNNHYTVNKLQSVPAGTKMRTLPSGLPWVAAETGGGDAEGATSLYAGFIYPALSKGMVGQIPAGRRFIRARWLGSNQVDRSLSVRDLDTTDGSTLRIQTTLTYWCED